ncbi:hypothetical protein KEM09_11165 [Carboxylicivirga mesophila]|uniref:Uncharacterized protein n=1 Tax=Carboxylicivirga mesophila TaxID=1166478 RepID=A0ABS5KCA3_9BACT|nr:hypothetical protein [Carboxylicivirga mesophila]MBS2211968.1 hypothetical protein [Carboxylicivirga mesophila]
MRERIIVFVLFMSGFVFMARAQHDNKVVADSLYNDKAAKADWDMSLAFKSQNVFRGLLPSASPAMATQAGVIWGDWIFGMYGGVGLNGVYQETDFILVYRQPRFNVHLEYYYNFTQGITDIPDPSGIFDFNKQTTRGLLDLIVNVQLDNAGHWHLKSSTLVFGRDNELEYIQAGNELISYRGAQRYTQYLALEYGWYWGDNKVKAHVGGAFSLHDPTGAHFYGAKPGFNDIGIAFTRKIKVGENARLPVKVAAVVNPLADRSYLTFSVDLIQLSKL